MPALGTPSVAWTAHEQFSIFVPWPVPRDEQEQMGKSIGLPDAGRNPDMKHGHACSAVGRGAMLGPAARLVRNRYAPYLALIL
jgi:hypothetical protein